MASTAETEWMRSLAIWVAALLLLETVTGLSIFLLPFSIPNQVAVLVHTIAGVLLLLPFAWYQFRHWKRYVRFANRISYTWDLVHIVSTFALIASVGPHVVSLLVRGFRAGKTESAQSLRAAQSGYALRISMLAAAMVGVVLALSAVHTPIDLSYELPDDYSYLYGPDRPFAPSLASTITGGPFDERVLSGSESCGTAGCHEEIAREWSVSAHRWSAMDAAFVRVQDVMAEQNGAESTRYCGGCHDPISLFSGTKNVFVEDPAMRSGRPTCRAMRTTSWTNRGGTCTNSETESSRRS